MRLGVMLSGTILKIVVRLIRIQIEKEKRMKRREFLNQCGSMAGGSLLVSSALHSQNAIAQETRPTRGIEGQLAPELEVDYWIERDGKPGSFSIEASRGKWVFLKFFQNWCPGCHSSGFPTLQAFVEKYNDHPDVAIAAVQTVFEGYNSNTIDAVRELQLRYELPIMMGHDQGVPELRELPSTMSNYRTGGTPWLVLISPDGKVRYNDFHVKRESLIEYMDAQLAS